MSSPVQLRVLVADDCPDIADTLAALITTQGHSVEIARDGLSAVRIAASSQPDVIVLDIGMPGIDGYEAARQIRHQRGAEVVLIAFTAWTGDEVRRAASQAGFDRHMAKPADLEALLRLLATLSIQKQAQRRG